MKFNKSALEKICQQVFAEKCVTEAKKIFLDFLDESKMNEHSKNQIRDNLKTKTTKMQLDYYLCNSLLYHEGHSINRYK